MRERGAARVRMIAPAQGRLTFDPARSREAEQPLAKLPDYAAAPVQFRRFARLECSEQACKETLKNGRAKMRHMKHHGTRCTAMIVGACALSIAACGGAAAADLPLGPPQAQAAPPRYAPPQSYYAPPAEEDEAYPPPPAAYGYPPPVAYADPPPAYYEYEPPPVVVVPRPYWSHYWGGPPRGRFIAGGYGYERPFGHPFERFPEHAWGRYRGW